MFALYAARAGSLIEVVNMVGSLFYGTLLGAFVLAGLGTAGAAILLGTFASPGIAVAMGLVLGAIAIAGSPGATLVVTKELEDPGPLGRLVLALAAANDALAIMVFGLCLAIANATLGGQVSPLDMLLVPLLKTVGAVALGLLGGLLIDVVGGRFHNRSDVLIFGLAIIVGCGAAASAAAGAPRSANHAVSNTATIPGRPHTCFVLKRLTPTSSDISG